MLHITSLHNIYLSETQPFRKVHRMIDLFETIIKTHTAVMMGEYFKHNQISDTAKGMLAAGLRTPSLGTWQLFSRELYKELAASGHDFLCKDFATAFEDLDKTLNNIKTNVISFRNGYAHGATPTDEQCENDIKQFEPFLNTLLSLPWLKASTIEAVEGKVYLRSGTDSLNLHPIIAYRADETEQPFVFFNDLKNDKVGLLNYPLSKHYRDKSFFSEFNQYLPLKDWKKTGSNIFNQRIEELTETFKGRLTERATIKNFLTAQQKGFLSIQGNPGIGKSALIAQVYKDLTNSEEKLPIQLVEYFIRRGTPQVEVSFLINHLLKKTDELFPAGKEIRAEGQTTWELQQQLYNKWTAFGETESPFKIIFLIDGLDEGVENDILKYIPRETFNNILFIYGSRPGGHQQLEKFWGELPIEHHQKIELGGLSKEDIRALLYEVANKYEIDKDSKWIDYLQQRSQGNPLYLKLLCNAIEEGSIAINDVDALPKEIDDYYKAILQRYAQMPDGDYLLNSLFVFAAARDYLTPNHLSEILGFGPATQTNVMSTLVEVLYENPMTENVLDYQLFHESLREYLKKDRATEVAKAEQKIIEFCGRWKTLEGNFEQQYVLRHYAAHLSTQQKETHHNALIALTKDAEFIATQKKVLRNFEATHQLYQYGIEVATKYNWNEAAIDCGLGIVDVKYEEQNDVTAILEMVKQNEMDLALQRITALGGQSFKEKERQFIVMMLCIMELTLLDSKTQPWRKNAIEKLLGLMEEQIPVDHSVLNWDDFFPSYLMFLISHELMKIGINYIVLYKRAKNWNNKWIDKKGPYSDNQLDLLIQTSAIIKPESQEVFGKSLFNPIVHVLTKHGKIEKAIYMAELINDDFNRRMALKEMVAVLMEQGKLKDNCIILDKWIHAAECIKDDFDKSLALKEIAVVYAEQEKLNESNNILEKSIESAECVNFDLKKSLALNEIALVLIDLGKMEESWKLLEKSIRIAENLKKESEKSSAFNGIAVVLANQGEMEKSIHTADCIETSKEKSSAFKGISIVLANQGEIEKSIQMVECINDDIDKSSALKEISVLLASQGNLLESCKILERSIQLAEYINSDFHKIIAIQRIADVLLNNGKLVESSILIDKLIQLAECINSDFHKCLAFQRIADVLLNNGKLVEGKILIDKSIRIAEDLKRDSGKRSAFKGIAEVLINQGKMEQCSLILEKSINIAVGINNVSFKEVTLKLIAFVLAKFGKFEKSINTLENIKTDKQRLSALKGIAGIIVKNSRLEEINILEKLIQTAEGIIDYFDRSIAFIEIAFLLKNQGEFLESALTIKKSIQIAEGITDDFDKSSAFIEIAVLLANQGYLEDSNIMLWKSINTAENIKRDHKKSLAFLEIAFRLFSMGKLEESYEILEKSVDIAEGINDVILKKSAFSEIAVVLAKQDKIERSIQIAKGEKTASCSSYALKKISIVLAQQGKIEKAIDTAEEINDDFHKNNAFSIFAVKLANHGKLSESINLFQKITRGSDRMQAWIEIGKGFYKKHQLLNLHQTLSQLPNDEAVTFFKKGIAQSITATNATEENILQILPLVKADKESTEHLMQMHALYCAFFEKTPKEKIQKFNRSLNIQWALDVIAKFPKEENVVRLSTNLEEWIEEVEDEDDREQIELWAKQVLKGKITEEGFGEKVKGMG